MTGTVVEITKLDCRHAVATDAAIASDALDAALAAFGVVVGKRLTRGTSLHTRAGRAATYAFVEHATATYGTGADEFADYSAAKAATAANQGEASHVAFRYMRDNLPAGASRWTGGAHAEVVTKHRVDLAGESDDPTNLDWTDDNPCVASASGAEGEIDWAVSNAAAGFESAFVSLREIARRKIEKILGHALDWSTIIDEDDPALYADAA